MFIKHQKVHLTTKVHYLKVYLLSIETAMQRFLCGGIESFHNDFMTEEKMYCYYFVQQDEVAEWLRRWTANPLGSARVGSNPILVVAGSMV